MKLRTVAITVSSVFMLAMVAAPVAALAAAKSKIGHWCGMPVKGGRENTVVLSGTLTKTSNWGPPNFGETPKIDSKFPAYVLALDFATPVIDEGNYGNITTVSHVQVRLYVDYPSKVFDPFLGHHVAVSGSLRDRDTAADTTGIVLEEKSIRDAGKFRCDGTEFDKPK